MEVLPVLESQGVVMPLKTKIHRSAPINTSSFYLHAVTFNKQVDSISIMHVELSLLRSRAKPSQQRRSGGGSNDTETMNCLWLGRASFGNDETFSGKRYMRSIPTLHNPGCFLFFFFKEAWVTFSIQKHSAFLGLKPFCV